MQLPDVWNHLVRHDYLVRISASSATWFQTACYCRAELNYAQTTTLNTIERYEEGIIAVRSVPVILKKNGKKGLCCKLFPWPEGSDTTYINEDVVEMLVISTQKEEISINIANDQKVWFMAATLEIGPESVANTGDRICGGIKRTDWVTMTHQ